MRWSSSVVDVAMLRNVGADRIRRLYEQGKSAKEIGDAIGTSWRNVISYMERHGIPRRSRSEATYRKANPDGDPFRIKPNLSLEEERLKALALGLFWGEGSRRNAISVRLCNSDPRLLRSFVSFLRVICGVRPEKLRAHLILHEGANSKHVLEYWSRWLEIPLSQFSKVTRIPSRGQGTYKSRAIYGTAAVYVHNSKLRRIISDWLDEYAHVAQSAERDLGKIEVAGSIPAVGFVSHIRL